MLTLYEFVIQFVFVYSPEFLFTGVLLVLVVASSSVVNFFSGEVKEKGRPWLGLIYHVYHIWASIALTPFLRVYWYFFSWEVKQKGHPQLGIAFNLFNHSLQMILNC